MVVYLPGSLTGIWALKVRRNCNICTENVYKLSKKEKQVVTG